MGSGCCKKKSNTEEKPNFDEPTKDEQTFAKDMSVDLASHLTTNKSPGVSNNPSSSRQSHPLNNSSGKSNGSANESNNSSSGKRGNEQSPGLATNHPLLHPSHSNPPAGQEKKMLNNNVGANGNNSHIAHQHSAGVLLMGGRHQITQMGHMGQIGQMGPMGRIGVDDYHMHVNMTDDSRDNSSNLLIGEIGDYDDLVDSDLTFFQDSIFTFVSWWKV